MPLTPDHAAAVIDPGKPLLIVDVDEVLALFVQGFSRFLGARGYELRFDRFALFENIYRPGEAEHLDIEAGRTLFHDFFRIGSGEIDPVPHAAESLRGLAGGATVVILTNAPEAGRPARSRWLARHGMDYPLIFNTGVKGKAVAALAARTSLASAFVDDLLGNLDSAAEVAPQVHRFQLVADERLRPLAPAAPERHWRADHWPTLASEIATRLGIPTP